MEVEDSVVTKPSTIDPDLGIDINRWQGRGLEMSKGFPDQDMSCIQGTALHGS